MYQIAAAQSFLPQQEFYWHAAYRAVSDAIAALEDAGASLLTLADDTQWEAQGTRALNAAIVAFANECSAAITPLRLRLWELEAARE